VKDNTYICTILINKNELRPKTEKRITNANTEKYALLPLLNNQSVLEAEQLKIYKKLARPVATHKQNSGH
jgi:hypothetical protein